MDIKKIDSANMQIVETLAGGVAHDFNNLLMAIQGRLCLMLKDLKPSHPHHRHLMGIMQSVEKGSNITAQLLGFAGGGQYRVESLELNDLIAQILEDFSLPLDMVELEVSLDQEALVARVDRFQLIRVFTNILENAIVAMPRGGALSVSTEYSMMLNDQAAKSKGINPGEFAVITIRDTGVGMDGETIQRIFDPFYTTQDAPDEPGKGLGLAACYGIVKNHGGVIEVWSTPGEGTTVAVIIPLFRDSDSTESSDTAVVQDIIMGFENVLLVDDEDIILDVGRDILEELGYRMATARSGDEAVRVYQEDKNGFDLVILDQIMPGMDGMATLSRLKELDPGVKVLLSTGSSINQGVQEMLEAGCHGIIFKPYDIVELSIKIREVLEL